MGRIRLEQAQKELAIFLLIAFGLPVLMMFPMAILAWQGKDVTAFAAAQMFYPAAGLMLAKLLCEQEKHLLPKTFFVAFLVMAGMMTLWCLAMFFFSEDVIFSGTSILSSVSSLVLICLYLSEKKDARMAYGLNGKNWRLSIVLFLLFVLLVFVSIGLFFTLGTTGDLSDGLSISYFYLTETITVFPLAWCTSIPLLLGEEYGWRFYFQPMLQRRFGLRWGVLLFSLLWNVWHLSLVWFLWFPMVDLTLVQFILTRLVFLTALSIFMAYVYMRTNNVWLPTLVHGFVNSNPFFQKISMVRAEEKGLELLCSHWELLGIGTLILAVLFVPFLFSTVFREKGDRCLPPLLPLERNSPGSL